MCAAAGALALALCGAAPAAGSFRLLGYWGGPGFEQGQFVGGIGGIATDAAGDVDVVDSGAGRIEQFSAGGAFEREWGGVGSAADEMRDPTGIAVAAGGPAAGDVYVADSENRRIDQFAGDGTFIRAWGWGVHLAGHAFERCTTECRAGEPHGEDGGGFETPIGVAVDPASGDVYVSDPQTGDFALPIQKFTAEGEFIETVGLAEGVHGPGAAGTFNEPTALATDAAGDLYAVDAGNERIEELDSAGLFLRTWGRGVHHGESGEKEVFGVCTSECQVGGPGTAAGDFDFASAPATIAVDGAGNVWVPDGGDERVQEFTAAGAFELGFGWGVLDMAEAFETCSETCREGRTGGEPPEFANPRGAAAAPSGCPIYVSDGNANSLVDEFGACMTKEEEQKAAEEQKQAQERKQAQEQKQAEEQQRAEEADRRQSSGESGSTETTTGVATTPRAIEEVILGCTGRELVLNDVLIHGSRVVLTGSAEKALAGRTVRILFDGVRRVASAVVEPDGQFTTTAPLPPARVRSGNGARYMAELGALRSLNLKLTRRLQLEPPKASAGIVTLTGQVVPPLAEPAAAVTVQQELECGHSTIAATFRPAANGRFRVSIKVSAGARAGVYRLSTTVRETVRSRHGFATYSLPLPVALG